MFTWDDVHDFMDETCGICGCLLNNWPECEEDCIHTGNLSLCPRPRHRERFPGDDGHVSVSMFISHGPKGWAGRGYPE